MAHLNVTVHHHGNWWLELSVIGPNLCLTLSLSLSVPQMRIVCKDVTAETLYDVLHDTSYRKEWDTNMIDTYDIGRLTVNADVGYYSC